MKFIQVLTLPGAHILYISALGRTLPVMNLGIQSKIVFESIFVFLSVFVARRTCTVYPLLECLVG